MSTLADPHGMLSGERGHLAEPPAVLRDLAESGGVRINGHRRWDMQVYDERAYRMILTRGTLGLGEAYMDGLWSCPSLAEFFSRMLGISADEQLGSRIRLKLFGYILRQALFNLQSSRRAFQVGKQHYDIGNDVFEAMLDPTMSYSCGYWAQAKTLAEAQLAKLDLICRKLELRPGERLLDIGCGWGGLARFAAERYGVDVTGITISHEQQALARARCAGLRVRIELMDYRELTGRYDKIVSVGMFEHVGPKNYAAYFDVISRVLAPEGLFLLHTIGLRQASSHTDPWIDKYIFPNGKLPAAREIAAATEERFVLEDWHNFGPDYDTTLMAWWENFERAWPTLAGRYDERFRRMWTYYLMSCAGLFRSRQGQLWQLVLSQPGRRGVYRSVR